MKTAPYSQPHPHLAANLSNRDSPHLIRGMPAMTHSLKGVIACVAGSFIQMLVSSQTSLDG